MTEYVKSTNFTSKDSLASGNPLKIIKGAEFDTEFNNIATAVATKADLATVTSELALKADTTAVNTALALKASLESPTLTGTPVAPTASVNTNTTQVATTAFVVAQIADDAPTKTGTGSSGTWDISITGNAATATSATNASTVTTLNTSQVLAATAGASVGEVGTYAFLGETGFTATAPGGTRAGSALRYAGLLANTAFSNTSVAPYSGTVSFSGTTTTPAGTWRAMGQSFSFGSVGYGATLWLRIS